MAIWLVRHIDTVLDHLGISRYQELEQAVYFVIIVCLSIGIGVAVRIAVVWAVRKIVRLRDGFTGRQLLEQHVVQKCSHFIAPLVFLGLMPFAVDAHSTLMRVLMKIVLVYAILAVAYGIASVLTFVFVQVNTYRNKRNLPLKGVLNVALGILWIVVAIIAVSVLVGKSPGTLLAGLGAFGL